MRYAIVYSSRTGNTACLAQAIREALPAGDCLYFGPPDPRALEAERIYIGFWTDRGSCDGPVAEFMGSLTHQQVFLFGTAGFGRDPAYFEGILARAARNLPASVQRVGGYMCQGRMPQAVRTRYEGMEPGPRREMLLENFDQALAHPDAGDLARLKEAVTR